MGEVSQAGLIPPYVNLSFSRDSYMSDDSVKCSAVALCLDANFTAKKECVIMETVHRITIQTRHALEMGLLAK